MKQEPEEVQPPVEVPPDQLSDEALHGLIESFILREGTDYGREEVSLATKMDQVRRQIAKGDVKIVFDPNTETVTLLTKREWTQLQNLPPAR